MDIVIYGTGNIGSIVATYLQCANKEQKHTISLVGRRPYIDLVKEKGLIYVPYNCSDEKQWIRSRGFQVYSELQAIPKIDVLFLTMKGYSLESSLKQAETVLRKFHPITIITMNGLGLKEIVAKFISPDKIIETIANCPSKIEENKIISMGGNSTIYAENSDLANKTLAPLLVNDKLDFKIDPKFKLMQWKKFTMNTGMNAVASIPLLRIGEVLERETLKKIITKLVSEVLTLAKQEHIEFDEDMYEFFWRTAHRDPQHRTSTQQDVINHKPTEVDFFNGYVVKKGKEYGIPTPANDAILTLMHIIDEKI
jgi:2-dehydropantoate 2-reductase